MTIEEMLRKLADLRESFGNARDFLSSLTLDELSRLQAYTKVVMDVSGNVALEKILKEGKPE